MGRGQLYSPLEYNSNGRWVRLMFNFIGVYMSMQMLSETCVGIVLGMLLPLGIFSLPRCLKFSALDETYRKLNNNLNFPVEL